MYFYKALLAVLVLGNTCLANPEFYIVAGHPHHQNYSQQQYQQPPIGQSILAGIASNMIPGVTAAYAVCSFARSFFGGNKKRQHAQEACPPPQDFDRPSYPYPDHSGYADVYPYYYQQPEPQSAPVVSEPIKPVDIHVAKKQHLQKRFDQHAHDLAAYAAECTSELSDYSLATDYYDRLKKRSNALNVSQKSPYYLEKTYTVSDNALRLLQEKTIVVEDYRTCYGNQLQQALHAEVLTIIAQTADIYYTQPAVQELPLTELLIDFTDLGRECNQAGSVIKALTTLDACWCVLDCMHAVVEGVAQGAWKTLKALSDPVTFVGDMLHGITTVARYIALVVVEVGDISITFCVDKQQGRKKFNKACTQIDAVYKAIWKTFQAMPVRKFIKEGTSFATECYLSGKALTAVGNFYGKAKKCASRLPAIFKDGTKDYSLAITTPEGFTFNIADKTANALKMSAENAFTGRVVKSASQLCPEFTTIIDIEKRVEHLKQLFDRPKNIFAEIKDAQCLTLNFEHIFSIEVVELYKKGVLTKSRLSGFHHDYMGKLEAGGMFVKEVTKTGPAGAYRAKININGTWFDPKTFFPQNWNDEKVVSKILESLENLTKNPKMQINKNWQIIGETSEGLAVETIIDQSGKVITSYPKLEQF